MTSKWMLGTAMAAVLVATPALAQQSEFGECAIDEWTESEFLGLDVEEPGLTMDEYRDCLEEAGMDLDEDEMSAYEAQFEQADLDDDAVLMYAEVQAYREEQQAAADEDGGPEGTVTVTQPAPEVVVEQPSPDVVVEQAEPDVAVTTPEPEVDVTTPQPDVEVAQPSPDVEVEQDQPTVMIDQPEPEVAVQQPEPEVDVEAGQPAVEVETAQPDVDVEQPTPEVDVEQAELDVDVQQQDPDVAVQQAQPDVEVEQTAEVDAETGMTGEAEGEMTEMDTAAADMETDAATEEVVREYQIRVSELEGEDVYNTAGEELGEIEEILLDPNANSPVVIISIGGLFGIGDRDLAFPYDDLSLTGDTIVLNTDMSEDDLENMEEYDETAYEELPQTMRME